MGNAGRNILGGPGLFQVDLALQRRFVIGDERSTGALNLGYDTGTARQMQFMLRVNF